MITRILRLIFIASFLGTIFLGLSGFEWSFSPTPDTSIIQGNGIIEATEVEITSKVPGKISILPNREGDKVKKGDELATLEGQELEGQVIAARGNFMASNARLAELEAGTRPEEIKRARALFAAAFYAVKQVQARKSLINEGARKEQIAQAKANLLQANALLEDADREYKRIEILEKDGAASGQVLDQLQAKRDGAKAQVEAIKQKLSEIQSWARNQELLEAEAIEMQAHAQLDAASAAKV